MKRRDFLNQIKPMDADALKDKATSLAEELMRLRFKQASKQLEKGHLLGETRRQLARVQTMLTGKSKA